MLEVAKELEYAPITELSDILDISKWITGAYAFENFGNAYQIADLIESENKNVSERLRRFSDLMNLNHLGLLQKEVHNLAAIKNMQYDSQIPSLIITPIVNAFLDKFEKIKSHSLFQLRLAEWQCEHRNYTAAYISMLESIVTFACESNHRDWEDYDTREEAKAALRRTGSSWKINHQLCKVFRETNHIRNSLAHSLETEIKYDKMIRLLNDNLKTLTGIIKA